MTCPLNDEILFQNRSKSIGLFLEQLSWNIYQLMDTRIPKRIQDAVRKVS